MQIGKIVYLKFRVHLRPVPFEYNSKPNRREWRRRKVHKRGASKWPT